MSDSSITPFRTITLTAMNDRHVFAGACHAGGGWIVITLDDTEDLALGHVISGCLDCSDGEGFFRTVFNRTTGRNVRVCIENWGLTPQAAIGFLKRLGFPESIRFLE